MKPETRELIQLVNGLFVIMDPGRDQDDEDTLVLMNRAVRIGILETIGVVANLRPSIQRARLAKGTLDSMGMDGIPVGFGSGCDMIDDDSFRYEFQVGYMAPVGKVTDGECLIVDTLRNAPRKGIVLTLISQLTDAAGVLREHRELFCEKVRRVVIMGGVVSDGDVPKMSEEGYLLPDPTAQNHAFDISASEYLYRELQASAIPLTVLSRHAAAGAKIPRSVYDDMADTGHPVGIRLRDAQRCAIEELWRRANMPADDVRRSGLPGRCDTAWFLNTFCDGEGADRAASDGIWDLVRSFMLYDPCTLIAAMPGLREYFYDPYVHESDGVEHLVIGVSARRQGVTRPQELAEYLHSALVESLRMSMVMNRSAS